MNECKYCLKVFTKKCNLERHEGTCKSKDCIKCIHCGEKFTRKDNMKRHEETCKVKEEAILLDKKIELAKTEETVLDKKIELKKLEASISINGNKNTAHIDNSNTTINISLDISQRRFDAIVDEKYTFDVYEAQRIVDKVIMPFFCNEEGVNVATLTDRDRMILKILDESTGKYVKKSPTDILSICKKSVPMKEKTDEYEDRIMLDVFGNPREDISDALINNTMLLKSDSSRLKKSLKNRSDKFSQK